MEGRRSSSGTSDIFLEWEWERDECGRSRSAESRRWSLERGFFLCEGFLRSLSLERGGSRSDSRSFRRRRTSESLELMIVVRRGCTWQRASAEVWSG